MGSVADDGVRSGNGRWLADSAARDGITFFATGGDAPLLDFAPWRAPGVQWLIAEGALQGKPNAVGTY